MTKSVIGFGHLIRADFVFSFQEGFKAFVKKRYIRRLFGRVPFNSSIVSKEGAQPERASAQVTTLYIVFP